MAAPSAGSVGDICTVPTTAEQELRQLRQQLQEQQVRQQQRELQWQQKQQQWQQHHQNQVQQYQQLQLQHQGQLQDVRAQLLAEQQRGQQIRDAALQGRMKPEAPKARRQRTRWTEEEVAALDLGVRTFGEGRWEAILDTYAAKFQSCRTVVDLKDKWRNMQKAARV